MDDTKRDWKLKSVPEEVRTGVTLAARKARMGISEWAVRALWAQLKAEQEASTALVVQNAPEPQPAIVPAGEMAEVLTLFAQLREAAGDPPARVRREAWAIVEERLKAIRGHDTGASEIKR